MAKPRTINLKNVKEDLTTNIFRNFVFKKLFPKAKRNIDLNPLLRTYLQRTSKDRNKSTTFKYDLDGVFYEVYDKSSVTKKDKADFIKNKKRLMNKYPEIFASYGEFKGNKAKKINILDKETGNYKFFGYRTNLKNQKTINTNKELRHNKSIVNTLVFVDTVRKLNLGASSKILVIEKSKIDIHKNSKKKFNKIKNKGENLLSKVMENVNGIKDKNNGFCVPDAVYEQIKNNWRYKNTTKQKIYNQFEEITEDIKGGASIDDIKEWQKKYGKYINVYVLDGLRKVTRLYAPDRDQSCVNVSIMMTNGHCTSITNENVKHDMSKKGRVELFKIDIDLTCDNYILATKDNIDDIISGYINNNVILEDEEDMKMLMNTINKQTGYMIEQFDFRGASLISAFIHPVTGKIIMEYNNYELRKSICDKSYKKYNNNDFLFKNQSITSLSANLFKMIIGKFDKSSYNQLTKNAIDMYGVKPITEGYSSKYSVCSKGFDVYKSYSSVLYNNKYNIPIYNIFCAFEDYDNRDIVCGEYFIDELVINKYKGSDRTFKLVSGIYGWNLITYLIENKLMKKKNIKKMLIPCAELPYEIFNKFVKEIYNNFNEIESKNIINMMIGNWGTKYNKSISGCIVDNEFEAHALHAKHDNIEIHEFNNMYLVKQTCKNKLLEDNTSINRFVVSGGIVNILNILKKTWTDGSKLIAIRTDCVYLDKYIIPSLVDKEDTPLNNLGKIKIEEEVHNVLLKEEVIDDVTVNEAFEDLQEYILKGNGIYYFGMAGSRKTEEGTKLLSKEEDKKQVALSFTNKNCNNMRKRFEIYGLDKDEVVTLSKFINETFLSMNKTVEKISTYDTIWIDEVSMCPTRFLSIIYKAWEKSEGKLKVILTGDMNQIVSIQNEKRYDYLNNSAIKQMCPNIKELQYDENCGRFDINTYDMLTHFLKYNNLNGYEFNKKRYSEVNICKTNKTRQFVNKSCDKKHKGKEIKFIYQGKPETYKVYEGMKLMCTYNYTSLEMNNGEIFILEEIKGNKYIINGNEFTLDDLSKNFIVSYCITSCKFQGDKIDEPYNIFDANLMTANELYVSLSRTTKYDYIQIDKSTINNKYAFHDFTKEQNKILNIIKGGIYEKSKIYVIECDDKYYVGSTTTNLTARLGQHKKDIISPIYGKKKAIISLITNIKCYNRKELEEREQEYVIKYCKKYGNEKILNKNLTLKETVKIEPKIIINKCIDNKYKIIDCEKDDYFLIQWIVEGKRFRIKRRYNNSNKEKKYNEINEKRNELVDAYSGCTFLDMF